MRLVKYVERAGHCSDLTPSLYFLFNSIRQDGMYEAERREVHSRWQGGKQKRTGWVRETREEKA